MTYLIEAPHSPDECVQAMDEALAKGPRFLAQFDWGCVEGEHTGWATVEAEQRIRGPKHGPRRRAEQGARRQGGQGHSRSHQRYALPSRPRPRARTTCRTRTRSILAGQDEEAEEAEERAGSWGPEAWVTP